MRQCLEGSGVTWDVIQALARTPFGCASGVGGRVYTGGFVHL